MAVPIGAPTIIARFMPKASLATAVAARSGGAARTATTIAWAKKVDVTRAVTTRAANSHAKPGATAEPALPTTATPSSTSSSHLRCARAVSAVSTGPPTIMPAAYAVTSSPAAPTRDVEVGGDLGQDAAHHELAVVMAKTQNIRVASRVTPVR